MDFAATLLHWYDENKRPLAFRATTDPYKIWLSEIILQQTRVEQGMPYYHSFTNAYPTIVDLANAHEDAVMRLWQGLGYYSRARNLHQTAKIVAKDYNGKFPCTYAEIANLKGIGPYTAGAIASIAFGEKAAAVDGNVFRFLSRYFGIDTPVPSEKARKEFSTIVLDLMGNHHSGTFNQALIEFGALQCKPQSPACLLCPFNATCFALNNGKVAELPVKNKAAASKNRYFHYFIIKNKKQLLLQQRTAKDIWQQLYEFPLVEMTQQPHPLTPSPKERGNILGGQEVLDYLGKNNVDLTPVGEPIKHVLSHQNIYTGFYVLNVADKLPSLPNAFAVDITNLDNYGLPRVITLFLEKNNIG
jgi:A/G-specific adenine glycosylase